MVTIHNLEVSLDVKGEDDEAVFARLFARHIAAWSRERDDDVKRRASQQTLRALGDRDMGGEVA